MSKKKLFDDDSEEEIDIKTENEYAKKYDSWRGKEEIHKLEQKYGPKALNSDGSGSSDSEDESDEPPEVSEEVETQFLKTLALLKTKDPRIYDPNFKCFDQEEEKKSGEKSAPKMLTFDDSEDDDDVGGDIFKIEKKAEIDDMDLQRDTSVTTQRNKKEKNIKEYLTGKAEHIDQEVEKDLAPLKALWSDPKLNEGEAFLRDYILNKRYLEVGEATAGPGPGAGRLRDDADLEADERTVEEQSKFERAYNFRFEEPDDEYLKRFPRTMSSTRPRDDRRARKRAEVRARKDEQKTRKMEEIARLKALKLKEIQEKIAKIKEVTGNEELAFKEEDIEGDFDPEEHDRRMRVLFDDQYYGDADQHKPHFPDLDEELEIENWDNYEVGREDARGDNEPHCEDEDFNMDAEAGLQARVLESLPPRRGRRKRQSRLQALLAAPKPAFLPDQDKTYDQHMEEYYQMDCEDVVGGDLPTRFKYREVVPNDYGLTVEEILLADDRELTQWVPLKKIVKHRGAAAERSDVAAYARRARDARLKLRLLPSLARRLPEEPELVVTAEEGSKKKKKKKKKEANASNANGVSDDAHSNLETKENGESDITPEVKQKKKKKKKYSEDNEQETEVDKNKEVLDEYDTISSAEVKKKKKNKKKQPETEDNDRTEECTSDLIKSNSDSETNKRKKNKKLKPVETSHDNDTSVTDNLPTKLEKKHKNKSNTFEVQEVSKQGPSQESSFVHSKSDKKQTDSSMNTLKRKLTHEDTNQMQKKMKHDIANIAKRRKDTKMNFHKKDKLKNKNKFKKNQTNHDSNDNPLSKLSDERLKAYGLNPKKYKKFLKYKKF